MNKNEYDVVFMDEWNKIFPSGFKKAIDQINEWVNRDPNSRSRWDVVANAMQIIKDGIISDMMIAAMSRCYNPDYISPSEERNLLFRKLIYGPRI